MHARNSIARTRLTEQAVIEAAEVMDATNNISRKSAQHCCVPHCTSDSRYDPTLHFHSVPKNPILKKQWITKIRRDEGPLFQVTKSTVVCSKHFTKDDYKSWTPVRKRLCPEAVPSIFDWSSEKIPRKPLKRKVLASEKPLKVSKRMDNDTTVTDLFADTEAKSSNDEQGQSLYQQRIEELEEKLMHKSHCLMDRYLAASDRAANYLASQIQEDGTLANSEANQDVAAMYKLTTLLLISGKITEAQRLLNRIKKDFLQANGDVVSFPDKSGRDRKSSSDAMSHHWNYLNVWIALGAQRLGRFDVSSRIFAYSKTFYSPAVNACCVTDPYDPQNNDQTVDTLNTAHLGLLLLYFGDLKTAKACGETLIAFVDRQPDFDTTFYQRMSAKTGELITNQIPDSLAHHFVIRKNQPYQLYFYIGYYVIFMTKLYKVTQERKYIDYAQKVLDFALDCDKSIYSFFLSHKVAYGAALVASETKFEKYHNLATTIADFLVSQQTDEGLFCKDLGIVDKFDQSAEIGIWLREIHAELASHNTTVITK